MNVSHVITYRRTGHSRAVYANGASVLWHPGNAWAVASGPRGPAVTVEGRTPGEAFERAVGLLGEIVDAV